VTAGLGASLLLEPSNKLSDGESLWKRNTTVASGRSSRLGRSGRLASHRGRLLDNGRRRADGGGGLGGRRDRRSRLGRCSRCGGRRTGAGAVPDLGAGDGVGGLAAVDVEQDSSVSCAVRLGHVSASGGERSRTARDADLSTSVVELGGALTVGLMESNDLGTDEVVAIREVGELDRDLALVGDELFNSPFTARKTLLEDLGPDSSLALGIGLCDVHHDGSLVGSSDGPLKVVSTLSSSFAGMEHILVGVTRGGGGVVVVPLEGDIGASSDLHIVGSGLATVANHGWGGDIEDRVVAIGRSLDSEVLALVLTTDDERLEGGVAGNELSGSESERDGGPHVEVCG
jgi:hypothetical protein